MQVFLTQMVVRNWNALPGFVVEADMLVSLKGLLDRQMDLQGIKRYGLCASR